MTDWIINILEKFGYLGLFFMMTLENVFPPIPSEIVLPFAGFLTTYSTLTITGTIIAATLGSLIGAMILYSVGLSLDLERLEKIIDRYGKFIRLTKEDLYRVDRWFKKYGYFAIFICRMIPLVRSLISIPAGMARVKLSTFLLLTFLGTFIWNILLIFAGFILAENWTSILAAMKYFSMATYIGLGSLCIIGVYLYIRKVKKQS